MEIQRNAPTLAGSRPCPSCQTPIERNATLCIHCGYNLATGHKASGMDWFAANRMLVVILTAGLLVVIAALAFLFWPEPAAPPPFVPAEPSRTAERTGEQEVAPAPGPEVAPAAAEPDASAADMTEDAPAPAGPAPEELAAQQAEQERLAREAERAAFEARKARAEQALRERLDQREPLATLGDEVEVRRRNGLVHKGTLQRFAGADNERVAVIATATREIGVPLVELDPASRRRLDRDYREGFIAHLLNTRVAEPAAEENPAED